MPDLLRATPELATEYARWFVNRRAYTRQSDTPHPASGRHYYYRPKKNGAEAELTTWDIQRHLEGRITLGLYAINPRTQRVKWMAIDADYRRALEDLLKLQFELGQAGIQAALEQSRRGGHLWILFESPVPAKQARIYIRHLAGKLSVEVKGSGNTEGIELFPKQDRVPDGQFGNAIRGPLGVHRAAGKRYWFYGAAYDLSAQMEYLRSLRRVSEAQLADLLAVVPAESEPELVHVGPPASDRPWFQILDYVEVRRRTGRNWVTQCPSCAASGHDRSQDNLAISVEEPWKYLCWAGCTKEQIRAALGAPRATADSQGGVSMNARAPHLVLPKPFLKRLEGAGIYCQTWVTAERQARTGRWVLRAVESGGASKDIGRYIGFFAITGDRLPWLQRLDRITASGVHAVTVAGELLSVEMARCDQTYQLLIAVHGLGPMQESKRPPVLSSVVYRGVDGQLSPELRQQGLTPEFFSRSGEVRPIPERYVEAVRLVTSGVTCINCRHAHALVERHAPVSAAI